MNAIVEAELEGQIVWYGSEIIGVRGTPRNWSLEDGLGEEHGPYDALILAIPAEPAANLLGSIAPLLAVTARGARVSPCWSASMAFEEPLEAAFDEMETKYGHDFSFDRLTDDELLTLEHLGRHAVDQDTEVTWQEKQNLAPLITLIELQRAKRGLRRHSG